MLLLLPLLLLAFFAWRGGNPVGIALIFFALAGEIGLALRMLRASVGGVGGHAEWLRDVSRRPRLDRDRGWLWATVQALVGAVIAAFG